VIIPGRGGSASEAGGSSVLTVLPGTAITPEGDSVYLGQQVSIPLITASQPTPGAHFHPAGGETSSESAHIIVLTASPISMQSEAVYRLSMNHFTREGVEFRQAFLDDLIHLDERTPSLWRNTLAHSCFGTIQTPVLADQVQGMNLIDRMVLSGALTDDEVPLALICVKGTDVLFVDMWAIRRHPVAYTGLGAQDPLGEMRAKISTAEAIRLQFQQQIEDERKSTYVFSVAAKERYRYLPPVGSLPTGGNGYRIESFFEGVPVQQSKTPNDPSGRELASLMLQNPIDLNEPVLIEVCVTPGSDCVTFMRATAPKAQADPDAQIIVEVTAADIIEPAQEPEITHGFRFPFALGGQYRPSTELETPLITTSPSDIQSKIRLLNSAEVKVFDARGAVVPLIKTGTVTPRSGDLVLNIDSVVQFLATHNKVDAPVVFETPTDLADGQ